MSRSSSHRGRDDTTPQAGRPRSRRSFLQTLASASAAVPFAGLALPVLAQTPRAKPHAPISPPVAPAPAATPPAGAPAAAPEDPTREADARDLFEIVKRHYGDRLDAAQLDAVGDDLKDNLGSGQALRKLDLTNADEPDVVFQAEMPEV
jgi:hypothetical protein